MEDVVFAFLGGRGSLKSAGGSLGGGLGAGVWGLGGLGVWGFGGWGFGGLGVWGFGGLGVWGCGGLEVWGFGGSWVWGVGRLCRATGNQHLQRQTGCGSKLNHPDMERRSWSMFPFTRATHFGVIIYF